MKRCKNKSIFAIFCMLFLCVSLACGEYAENHDDNAMDSQTKNAPVGQRNLVIDMGNQADGLIVKYADRDGLRSARGRDLLAGLNQAFRSNLTVVHTLATSAQLLDSMDRHTSFEELESMAAFLEENPLVEYAEPNMRMYPLFSPNDSGYSKQWHYFESTGGLRLPEAWDKATGQGAVVAVIDTGITNHSDLNGNILGGYDFISDSDTARDGDGRDSNPQDEGDWFGYNDCGVAYSQNSSWHGTHVAGTIAAVTNNNKGVAGVAYKAKVVPVRVLGKCGGTLADIGDAMIWASGGSVSGVPTNQNPVDVINMSLGGSGSCSNTFQEAVNTARNNGTTVVVAAGNSNENASNATPANCSGVVAVAATDRQGNRANYSNYGSLVDVAAPGGEGMSSNGVYSTLNSGKTTPSSESYAYYQGTSMAAPHVAGVVALLYQKNSSISPDEVETALKDSARSFPGTCNQCGAGLVDANAAVDTTGPTCGNGIPEGDEECDGETCCDGNCQISSSGTTCRASSGECDVEETCDGSNAECPADESLPDGTSCSGGECWDGECNSVAVCGNGVVEGDEECDTGDCCKTDCTFKSSNTVCRADSGECDVAENCSGSSAACPADKSEPDGTSCSIGQCMSGNCTDQTSGWITGVDETGISGESKENIFYSFVAGATATDVEISISGNDPDADLYVKKNDAVSTSSYDCKSTSSSSNESCTSLSGPGTYNILIFAYSAFTDLSLFGQWYSTGEPPEPECGNGIVEGDEECDTGDCCKTDCTFQSSNTVCRADSGECDVAENCSGSSAACPADEFEPDGTTCSDGECKNGSCESSGGGWF